MEELVLILSVIYTFLVGYVFACKADGFMRKHPRAFPGKQRMFTANPPVWQDFSEDACGNCLEPDGETAE